MQTLLNRYQMLKKPGPEDSILRRCYYRCTMMFDDENPHNLTEFCTYYVLLPISVLLGMILGVLFLFVLGFGTSHILFHNTHNMTTGHPYDYDSSIKDRCPYFIWTGPCDVKHSHVVCTVDRYGGCSALGLVSFVILAICAFIVRGIFYFIRYACFRVVISMEYDPEDPLSK